ncbi:MAG: hypothetical protein Tsb005_16230 [Gammaproteobacteria bacterium]
MKETILIIGAGPSGLVTAKEALEAGLDVVVLEKNASIGGVWAEGTGLVWHSLHTNLSKYSCMFSDFPWPFDADMFPTQVQLRQYLYQYAVHFKLLPHIRFNSTVVSLKQHDQQWLAQWRNYTFDHQQSFKLVIVASGFFSEPYMPTLPGLSKFEGRVLHSAHYKRPDAFRKRKVLIIGGAFSGNEIAADLVTSADKVYSAFNNPQWILPRYLTVNSANKPLPIDLIFYKRSKQSKSSIINDKSTMFFNKNKYLAALAHNQAIPALTIAKDAYDKPPFVAISDNYQHWITQGKIVPLRLQYAETLTFLPQAVKLQQATYPIDDVIICSGYRAQLPFFEESLLNAIDFDAEDQFQPLLLHRCMFHPKLPNLIFVGMYRGPFFTTIELQARWAVAVLAGKINYPTQTEMEQGIQEERKIREEVPRMQFPHGNFVEYADRLAHEIGVMPDESRWYDSTLPIISAQYRLRGLGAKPDIAEQILQEAQTYIRNSQVYTSQTNWVKYAAWGLFGAAGAAYACSLLKEKNLSALFSTCRNS